MSKSSMVVFGTIVTILLSRQVVKIYCQQYEVSHIVCTDRRHGGYENLEAVLKKPSTFQGYPFFPDNRIINPNTDPHCRIRPINGTRQSTNHSNEFKFKMSITDFGRCNVKRKEDFLTIRVWFPQLHGVVLVNDQDVVIMCKPANPTVIERKAAGFSGNIPQVGRVSGVVEKTPGSLEYMLALHKESTSRSGNFDLPLVGSIPIGTRLQLTATINTNSAWKYAKLMEVIVSNDPNNPIAPGYIRLVQNGCRNQQYGTIVPNQPQRPNNHSGIVTLQFEAFLLENMLSADRIWIHAQIKACSEAVDCIAQFCMDLFQPSGHGRKRRSGMENNGYGMFGNARGGMAFNGYIGTEHYPPETEDTVTTPKQSNIQSNDHNQASVDGNIGVSVIIPKEVSESIEMTDDDHCWALLITLSLVGLLLLVSVFIIVCLALRFRTKLNKHLRTTADDCVDAFIEVQRQQRPNKLVTNPLALQRITATESPSFILAKRVESSPLSDDNRSVASTVSLTTSNHPHMYVERPGALTGSCVRS